MKNKLYFLLIIQSLLLWVSSNRFFRSSSLSANDSPSSEEISYSPFAPFSPSETFFNLSELNPVEKSLKISEVTNQFTNVLPETKKPIVSDFPKDEDSYPEVRKNFHAAAAFHVNYYINSIKNN